MVEIEEVEDQASQEQTLKESTEDSKNKKGGKAGGKMSKEQYYVKYTDIHNTEKE